MDDEKEKPQVETSQQEKVVVQVQTDDDTILQKRSRKEFDVTESDLSRYGPDLVAFFFPLEMFEGIPDSFHLEADVSYVAE